MDVLRWHKCRDVVAADDTQLDAFFTFNNLKESFDSKADSLGLSEAFFEVFFQEFAEFLGLLADCIRLPLRKRSRWLGLKHLRFAILEAAQKCRNAKRSHASLLGVLLLRLGDEPGNVLDARTVFVAESEALALQPGFVDQHSRISLEARECDHQVFVDLLNLADCAHILQLGDGCLLNCQHDAVVRADGDRRASTVDCLEGILDLEELAIWGEDGDSFVVLCHNFINQI